MIVSTAGCQTLEALGTKEAKGTPGGDVSIRALVMGEAGPSGNDDVKKLREKMKAAAVPDEIVELCTPPAADKDGIGPALVPLALAGLQLAFSAASDAISGYVVEKKKRFTKSYGGHVNIPSFHIDGDSGGRHTSAGCIWLQRTPNDKKAPTLDKCDDDSIVSDIILALDAVKEGPGENGKSVAMTVRPVYVRACKFAASTKKETRSVKMQIGVGVSIVNTDREIGDSPVVTYGAAHEATKAIDAVGKALTDDGELFLSQRLNRGKPFHRG
ncbi:MAG: hypothetical protein ACR2RE_21105 [Geminicoccaceae bacterium]